MKRLFTHHISTPLGTMLAVADEHALYALRFVAHDSEEQLYMMQKQHNATITTGITPPLRAIEQELHAYFTSSLQHFTTPLKLTGTTFQQTTWRALQTIPFGKTTSYAHLAHTIHQPTAYRAVANANRANRFAIIIPCHRVIKQNGDVCGYNGGIEKKKWLLEHEAKSINKKEQL